MPEIYDIRPIFMTFSWLSTTHMFISFIAESYMKRWGLKWIFIFWSKFSKIFTHCHGNACKTWSFFEKWLKYVLFRRSILYTHSIVVIFVRLIWETMILQSFWYIIHEGTWKTKSFIDGESQPRFWLVWN